MDYMNISSNKYVLVMPVYNDWQSLKVLADDIEMELGERYNIEFLIVDDCSLDSRDYILKNSTILRLTTNVGHQRAIAIGLSYCYENMNPYKVIVMDSDGEDTVEGIKLLIESSEKNEDVIIFAKRIKRKESLFFRLFYYVYKILFRLFTGKGITFGNFSIIPRNLLKRVVYLPEIWSHYCAAITKSKVNYKTIDVERGKRIKGVSKMNFYSLVIHGLSAVSVHIEVVAVRLLVSSIILVLLSITGILVVSYFKFFTNMATPGWATSAISGFSIIIMQALILSIVLVLIVLNNRTQKTIIPIISYKEYIDDIIKE